MTILSYSTGQLPLVLYYTDIASYAPIVSLATVINGISFSSLQSDVRRRAIITDLRAALGGRFIDSSTRFSANPSLQGKFVAIAAMAKLLKPAPRFFIRLDSSERSQKQLIEAIKIGHAGGYIGAAFLLSLDPGLRNVTDVNLRNQLGILVRQQDIWNQIPWGPFSECGPPLSGAPICVDSGIKVGINTLQIPIHGVADWRNQDISKTFLRLRGEVIKKSLGEFLLNLSPNDLKAFGKKNGLEVAKIYTDSNSILHSNRSDNRKASQILAGIRGSGQGGIYFDDFVSRSWKGQDIQKIHIEGERSEVFLQNLPKGSSEWQEIVIRKIFDEHTVFSGDQLVNNRLKARFVGVKLISLTDLHKVTWARSDLSDSFSTTEEPLAQFLLSIPRQNVDEWIRLVNTNRFAKDTIFSRDQTIQRRLQELYVGVSVVTRKELLEGRNQRPDYRAVRLETMEKVSDWLRTIKIGSRDWALLLSNKTFNPKTLFSDDPNVQADLKRQFGDIIFVTKKDLFAGHAKLTECSRTFLDDGTLVSDYLKQIKMGSADWCALVNKGVFTSATIFDSADAKENQRLAAIFINYKVWDVSRIEQFIGTVNDYSGVYLSNGQSFASYLDSLKPGSPEWFGLVHGSLLHLASRYCADPNLNAKISQTMQTNTACLQKEQASLSASALVGVTCWVKGTDNRIHQLDQFVQSKADWELRQIFESRGKWRVLPLRERWSIGSTGDLEGGVIFSNGKNYEIATLSDYLLRSLGNYQQLIHHLLQVSNRANHVMLRIATGVKIGPDVTRSRLVHEQLGRLTNARLFTRSEWFAGGDYRGVNLSNFFVEGEPLEVFLGRMTVGSKEWRTMMHNSRFSARNVRLGGTSHAKKIAKTYLEKNVHNHDDLIIRLDDPDLWIRYNGLLYTPAEFANLAQANPNDVGLGEDPITRALFRLMKEGWK